jgi:hypothetical protein
MPIAAVIQGMHATYPGTNCTCTVDVQKGTVMLFMVEVWNGSELSLFAHRRWRWRRMKSSAIKVKGDLGPYYLGPNSDRSASPLVR